MTESWPDFWRYDEPYGDEGGYHAIMTPEPNGTNSKHYLRGGEIEYLRSFETGRVRINGVHHVLQYGYSVCGAATVNTVRAGLYTPTCKNCIRKILNK